MDTSLSGDVEEVPLIGFSCVSGLHPGEIGMWEAVASGTNGV